MSKQSSKQPPPRHSLRGLHKYLNIVEAPKVENRRLMALLIGLVAAVCLLSFGMLRMLPLKERVPYVVKVEADAQGRPTGNVSVSMAGVDMFRPGEANIRYFLGKWAIDLLSVDERSRSLRLPSSFSMLKGAALDDWKRYVEREDGALKILAADPSVKVRVELISIAFLSEKTALIRVKLVSNKRSVPDRRVQVTVDFAIIPPKTDEEVYRNPIGLWIMSFGVNNELA